MQIHHVGYRIRGFYRVATEAYPAQAKGIYEISATVPHSGTASSEAGGV
jgi:hypothetical protein